MAATYHGPLQTLNNPDNYCRSYRTALNAKRKSAVELLEETKPLYVKSCLVLDKPKQDPAHTAKCYQRAKSPRLVGAPQRRSHTSVASDQLQTKLRRLLNADSKENLRDGDDAGCRKNGEQSWEASRSEGTSRGQFVQGAPVHCKSMPDLSREAVPGLPNSSLSDGRRTGSWSKHEDMSISKSVDSDTEDSERWSEGGTSYGQPPSLIRSTVSLGGSAGKAETTMRLKELEGEGRRAEGLVRSKSDLGGGAVDPHQPQSLPQDLDRFFQYLGLTSDQYRVLTEGESRGSSPVFFSSGSSSSSPRASRRPDGSQDSLPPPATPGPSIVESNARVIKWLCHCSRA